MGLNEAQLYQNALVQALKLNNEDRYKLAQTLLAILDHKGDPGVMEVYQGPYGAGADQRDR